MKKLKKISLKKETVSSLNEFHMSLLRGGDSHTLESSEWKEVKNKETGEVTIECVCNDEVVVTPSTTPVPVSGEFSW